MNLIERTKCPHLLTANNLQPFIDEQLTEWTRFIEYRDLKGNRRHGYNARILRGLCKVYIDARKARSLLKSQERFADIAEVILYALSDVGIVALVDEATGYDKVNPMNLIERTKCPHLLTANNLQPFIDEQLTEWTRFIEYRDLKGNRRHGYNARILRGLCKVYIDARKARSLLKSQERFADIAEVILYALSDVGIVALVDEATGYDKVKNRAKDELQRFFKEALQEEAGKWVKTFSDSFFEMIYRMRGWNWTGASKKPSVVGIWINDIIYERIAPALLYELRKLNPKNEKGNRPYKHHQFLTEELGHPKLKEHISGVMAIGRLSNNNWAVFMRNLDKAYPKMYQQLDFDFDDNFDND
ncbi:P63C domain-containing protein [Bacteroides pyogenes]|uniref:P63C domain-containing protein n=1 Tax=Bacteroides pyogenes TaxID=310300 RepID=UPI0040645C12